MEWKRQMVASEAFTTLFDNQENCDVTFRIAAETIGAHKTFLQARSQVLWDLTKDWTAKDDPVVIDDAISYDAFKAVLRYIYSDEINITNDNVFEFLYAAQCYEMDHLEKHCTKHINESLNSENVCSYMNKAIEFNASSLKEECRNIFSKETKSVLASSEFVTLSQPALSAVLDVDKINVLEIDLFIGVKMWIMEQCKREKLFEDGPNMRKIIGEALYKIRFPTMTSQDFADKVVATSDEGLLTDTETVQVFRMISATKKADISCPFSAKFRGVISDSVSLAQSELLRNNAIVYNYTQNVNATVYNSFLNWLNAGHALNRKSLQIISQCCADLRNSNATGSTVAGTVDTQTKTTCWNIFNEYHASFNSSDLDNMFSKLHKLQETLTDLPH